MKKIRILSAILAILLAFSAVGLPVFAADIVDYPSTEDWTYQKLKVDEMEEMYSDENWKLYFDKTSAEFALLNVKTGEYTFSNPYDIAVNPEFAATTTDPNEDPIRQALLSQIILTYEDIATGATYTMKSFTDAVLAGGQISFEKMENGVRVEYAIGTVETKRLFPQWITKQSFEEQIYTPIITYYNEHKSEFSGQGKYAKYANIIQQLTNSVNSGSGNQYKLVGPAPENAVYDPKSTPDPVKPETFQYLVDNEGAQMYFLQKSGERVYKLLESMIREFCPAYTFDKLEEDHEITGYEGDSKEPPLFRMAIEYTIDKNGLTASIPAKSIRFNETNYRLETIALLPYFGCTAIGKTTGGAADTYTAPNMPSSSAVPSGAYTRNDGYLFIPDGSGTLLSYYNADGTLKSGIQGGSMYGFDYAIESLAATEANAEVYRVPVFGLVEEYTITTTTTKAGLGSVPARPQTNIKEGKRGFLAIIEEGEAFASVRATLRQTPWAGATGATEYSTVFALFTVKQNDSVNVGSSIGGSDSSMTATNDTKYIGNYTIRYNLLSDPDTAKAANYKSFDPSYIGMANAYRQYLINNGSLDKLTSGETESTLPLYIHSFGALNAQDTFLSIPVTVEKPLTTFADVKTMSEDLRGAGITNLNFILEGFANGNMSKPYYPTYVKWGKTVGGAKGLEELKIYADEVGINIYPDFDFSTAYWVKTFSGFSYRKHAARAMSGRYTTKRDYDYVFQVINKFGHGNVVSSGAYLKLFEKFAKDYEKYTIGGISVLSLGTDLSSDFNEDYSITREDSKLNTKDLLAELSDKYKNVVVKGGNAYTWAYATDILDISLDNSRYQISSASIPFIGMVLHGYMNYTGGVINTSGDIQYDVLKSLENGAALYFLLSYQNSNEFKNSFMMGLNENYSVNYSTWRDDVVKYYNQLNGAIGSLQTATITDHGFVKAYRANAKNANFLFAQSNMTQQKYTDAMNAYHQAIADVNKELDANNPGPAYNKYQEELRLAPIYRDTLARAEVETAFSAKEKISNVVYVTYTEDNGQNTTFYINYNTFDVAIELNGGIYILAAESFVNANDQTIEVIPVDDFSYEVIEALMPTAGQLKRYQTAKENYEKAMASGTQSQQNKAKEALNNAIAAIQKKTTNVVKLTAKDGSVGYFNYEQANILVAVGEMDYKVVASQSYVID
ncbi:MAG: hypothetical protein IKM00_03965 [Clostridia bacterium]|nr:hypothetical protein [Clostridia bacterium]